jgi:hypothetical protein
LHNEGKNDVLEGLVQPPRVLFSRASEASAMAKFSSAPPR